MTKKNPLKEIKQLVEEKIKWNETQGKSALRDFMDSNTRKDRDRVLKSNAKGDCYKELLEKINELDKEQSKGTGK